MYHKNERAIFLWYIFVNYSFEGSDIKWIHKVNGIENTWIG